ncbi:MAG TPA: PKD domain-containing protein [candidate division Zixibacteria bacterium]|nr:PKD domain-containing protein [candidate division Zixibacteria bacterium]
MRRFFTATFLILVLVAGSVASEEYLPTDPSRYIYQESFLGYIPNRFIVVLNDNVTIDHQKDAKSSLALSDMNGFSQLAEQFQVKSLRPQFPGADRGAMAQAEGASSLARHYKVTFEVGSLDEVMAAYEALPEVNHCEPIGVSTVYATPNDTYYDDPPESYPYDQWHYWDTYGIEADNAWDSETGSQVVLVGDLDIGTMYDHGDLGGSDPPGPNDATTNGNIWINTNEVVGNGIDDDGNGYIDDIIGWDFVESTDWYIYSCTDLDCGGADNDPSDGNGHGTHTAGTIAAITNNGYAVAGIAGGFGDGTYAGGGNGVKLVPCRIGYQLRYSGYDMGVVIMDYVAEAMYYMAELKIAGWNVAAINCSFGTSNSGGLSAACDYLIAQDVMVIVAAGNSSSSSADYLGARTDCMDVGATDQDGNPASFSNYGSWVDVAAPGVSVLSTITDPSDPGTDYISSMDGTSMACPHVVGVAALLESYNPSLSAQDKWDLIVNNTKSYNQTKYVGVGIVDVAAALAAAGGGQNPPVANFSGSPTTGEVSLTVSFTDLSTNSPTAWSWDFGDGGTSAAQNPSYTYTAIGTYTVTLTATNAYGYDVETKVDYITVTAPAPPTANFSGSPTSGEAPLTVSFTDLSTGDPTAWSWDFGDGVGTSAAQNPSYIYNEVGTYTVTLTASNAYGSDDEVKTGYITVTEPGVAEKAYADSETSSLGTVSGSMTDTYASDNVYEGIIESESTSHPVKVTSNAEHEWTFTVGGGATVTFYLEAYRPNNSDGDDFIFSYSTDGVTYTTMVTVSSATEQVYTYSLPAYTSGTIYVQVKDDNRSWGNVSLDAVYIDEMYIEYETTPGPPVAEFVGSPTTGSYPLLVSFTDLSTGSPTSWSWDFGDGSGTSSAQNPTYTYANIGTYTVTLTATNAYGSDVETKSNYITVTDQSTGTMHVADIAVGRGKSGPNYVGTATVTIKDDVGSAVANATVYVTYDGPTSGSLSGTTGSSGTVSFQTSGVKKPSGEWCFEVTNVTHSTNTYVSGDNEVTRSCESGWVYGEDRGASLALVPVQFGLMQNYPNPFNPVTEIGFSISQPSHVTLEVFNIAGQRIATLVNESRSAGYHSVTWDGSGMASGIYLYRIVTNEGVDTRKMLLMK